MDCPIHVSYAYLWIEQRLVDQGQDVVPGDPIMLVRGPSGIAEEVVSSCFGTVEYIQGNRAPLGDMSRDPRAFDACEDGSSALMRDNHGLGHVYTRGDLICQIMARPEGLGGEKTGLRPRQSLRLRLLQLGFASQ